MCSECSGSGMSHNCPVCSDEPDYKACSHCAGNGYFYYNDDGDEITKYEYDDLPESERGIETCPICDGDGNVPVNDEDCFDEFEHEL